MTSSKKRDFPVFFMCKKGHGFLVKRLLVHDLDKNSKGKYPCIHTGCKEEATYSWEGGNGYCKNCGAPVWRHNPWCGDTILRFNIPTYTADDMRAFVCKGCEQKYEPAELLNCHCSCCGGGMSVVSDDIRRLCDDCRRD